MSMETLKDDLIDWIADTVAMNVLDDGSDALDDECVKDIIFEEMDGLMDDMLKSIDLIKDRACTMVNEYQEDLENE